MNSGKPPDPMDPRTGVDWVRVVANLRTAGMSLSEIARACSVTKTSILAYGSEDQRQEPRHSAGERILALWVARTGYKVEDVPTCRKPLSVSQVLRAHK